MSQAPGLPSFFETLVNVHTSPFPVTVDQLIEALDGAFPERCPDIDDSDRQVWFKAGQRSVVNFLRQWRSTAEEKQLPHVFAEGAKDSDHGRKEAAGLHQQVFHGRSRRNGRPPRA